MTTPPPEPTPTTIEEPEPKAAPDLAKLEDEGDFHEVRVRGDRWDGGML